MLSPLVARLRLFGPGFGLRFSGSRLRCRFRGVNELRDAGLDRLVGRQLGLGIELEIAFGPVESADHRVVAGLAIALGVKKMPEQEVQRRGFAVPIADGKGTCGPLTLSGFQKRSQGVFGQRAARVQQSSPEIGPVRSRTKRKLV